MDWSICAGTVQKTVGFEASFEVVKKTDIYTVFKIGDIPISSPFQSLSLLIQVSVSRVKGIGRGRGRAGSGWIMLGETQNYTESSINYYAPGDEACYLFHLLMSQCHAKISEVSGSPLSLCILSYFLLVHSNTVLWCTFWCFIFRKNRIQFVPKIHCHRYLVIHNYRITVHWKRKILTPVSVKF